MKSYVVTGCAGFIGSHLCERLINEGCAVVGIDSFSPYYAREMKERNLASLAESEHFHLVEGDLCSLQLGALLAEADGVFHLAAQAGVRRSWGTSFDAYVHDNVLATQRVFEGAVQLGIRVVWASSSSIYGNAESYPTPETMSPRPISPYGVSKLACEQLARAYRESRGLDHVALRYFTVYGPRQRPDMAFTRIARSLVLDQPFRLFGSGEQSRDVTYVEDAVRATIAAMCTGRAGRIYNVGGGSETSLNDIIHLLEDIAGRRLRVERDVTQAGDVDRTASDTASLRADVGWAPRVSIREGMTAHLGWVEEETAAGVS